MTDRTTLEHHMSIMRVFEQNPDVKVFSAQFAAGFWHMFRADEYREAFISARNIIKVEPVK